MAITVAWGRKMVFLCVNGGTRPYYFVTFSIFFLKQLVNLNIIPFTVRLAVFGQAVSCPFNPEVTAIVKWVRSRPLDIKVTGSNHLTAGQLIYLTALMNVEDTR